MKDMEKFFSKKDDTPGKIIKSFRKNFHITQAELCHATGISEKYLSAVENEKPLNKSRGFSQFRKRFAQQLYRFSLLRLEGRSLKKSSDDNREIGLEVATKIGVFFNFDPFFLLFPNGLEDLYEMYPEIKEESQKLITAKRKAG